jgi:hypothetical protein
MKIRIESVETVPDVHIEEADGGVEVPDVLVTAVHQQRRELREAIAVLLRYVHDAYPEEVEPILLQEFL